MRRRRSSALAFPTGRKSSLAKARGRGCSGSFPTAFSARNATSHKLELRSNLAAAPRPQLDSMMDQESREPGIARTNWLRTMQGVESLEDHAICGAQVRPGRVQHVAWDLSLRSQTTRRREGQGERYYTGLLTFLKMLTSSKHHRAEK